MIPQNKNVRQLVWYLWYVDIAVEGSELYCQALCRMDVTQLEQRAYIKVAILRGWNAKECYSELVETVGEQCLSIQNCREVGRRVSQKTLPQAHCGILHDAWLTTSFYRPLCSNIRVYCPLLQCLCTKSVILAGAHSYFVVSFKCKGKNSCHDLIPNSSVYISI